MPPKAGGCPPRHGHERIGRKDYGPTGRVFNAIKRCMVLRSLSLRYHCLGENVLANTLPSNPTAFTSKRKWETAIRKARETLRLTDELTWNLAPCVAVWMASISIEENTCRRTCQRHSPCRWRYALESEECQVVVFLSCKIIADGDATGTVRASRSVILCALHFFDFN